MACADLDDLNAQVATLREQHGVLDLRLKELCWGLQTARLQIATSESGKGSADKTSELLDAVRKLDERQLGLFTPKSSARVHVRSLFADVERGFSKSLESIERWKKRIEAFNASSVEIFAKSRQLSASIQRVVEEFQDGQRRFHLQVDAAKRMSVSHRNEFRDLSLEQQQNGAEIRRNEPKRRIGNMVHDITKFIPGTNLLTYPATKLVKRHYNRKSTALQDRGESLKDRQVELEDEFDAIKRETEAVQSQLEQAQALEGQMVQLQCEGEKMQSACRQLDGETMTRLHTAQEFSRLFGSIRTCIDQLASVTEQGEHVRVRSQVVHLLKAIQKLLMSGPSGGASVSLNISPDIGQALEKAIQQYEKPVQWYHRGFKLSKVMHSDYERNGEL